MSADSISSYNAALDPQRAAICDRLRKNIDAALPQATSKMWHAIPVWLVGENVAVGYTARKSGENESESREAHQGEEARQGQVTRAPQVRGNGIDKPFG